MTTQTVSPTQLVVLKGLDLALNHRQNDGAVSTMFVQIVITRNIQRMPQATITRALNDLFKKGIVSRCGNRQNREWFFGICSKHYEIIKAAEEKAAKKKAKQTAAKFDSITAVRKFFAKL